MQSCSLTFDQFEMYDIDHQFTKSTTIGIVKLAGIDSKVCWYYHLGTEDMCIACNMYSGDQFC